MQTYFVLKGVRGYHRLMDMREYVNHPRREEIERRLKVIKFSEKHGLVATQEAFRVCRSTVYRWKQILNEADGGLIALASKSRAPKTKRKREVSRRVVQFILDYRTKRRGVGKVTIKAVLDEFCARKGLRTVSESTIGRAIGDLKKQGKLPTGTRFSLNARTGRLIERPMKPYRLKPRRKDYRPRKPGDLVQLDAIYVFEEGVKRYVISCIDLVSRFAFAWCYRSLSSLSAKDLLLRFLSVAPFEITHVQTDNGSESVQQEDGCAFLLGAFADHFRRAVEELGLVHFYNYPHHPQSPSSNKTGQFRPTRWRIRLPVASPPEVAWRSGRGRTSCWTDNGHVERFQRTLRDQFLNWCEDDPAHTASFNLKLAEWLLWYNTEKAHCSLGRLPPLRYLLNTFTPDPHQSNMLWTSTAR